MPKVTVLVGGKACGRATQPCRSPKLSFLLLCPNPSSVSSPHPGPMTTRGGVASMASPNRPGAASPRLNSDSPHSTSMSQGVPHILTPPETRVSRAPRPTRQLTPHSQRLSCVLSEGVRPARVLPLENPVFPPPLAAVPGHILGFPGRNGVQRPRASPPISAPCFPLSISASLDQSRRARIQMGTCPNEAPVQEIRAQSDQKTSQGRG